LREWIWQDFARVPELGLAVRADAPAARDVGFASFGRSRLKSWATWLIPVSQGMDIGHPVLVAACHGMQYDLVLASEAPVQSKVRSLADWGLEAGTEGRGVREEIEAETAVRLATFDQYRGLLFSVAYRMLGSVADAEDMLQETFLRWQQAAAKEIRSPRAFLVTIVSRLSINHLQSARVRREEYVGPWLPEPLVTDEGSDPLGMIRIDETLSMAFLVLLERLTPVERAVFLLREVFEYEYAEIAAALGQSEVNCRQILRRARQHVQAMRPRFKASPRKRTDLLEQFLRATGSGDMDGLLRLLAKDVVLYADGGGKGLAVPNAVRGADHVARGILGGLKKIVPKGLVRRIVEVNGEPGVVSYFEGKPFSVLTLEGSESSDWMTIGAIYLVTNPEKLSRLPGLASG
jgi:RNA polymerase sigma-70 factor (ECF subfamily)